MGFHTEKLTRRMSVNWAVRFGQCACPVALWLQQQYHLNTLTVKSTKNKKDNMAQPPPPYSEAFLDCGCDNLLGKEKDCITTLGYFEKFNRTEKKAWLARAGLNRSDARWIILDQNSEQVRPIDDVCMGDKEDTYPVIKWPRAEGKDVQLIIGVKKGQHLFKNELN